MGQLRSYQREAVQRLLEAERVIYGDAAGSGKTPTTAVWLQEAEATRTLVVAPSNKIIRQWARTLFEWTHLQPFPMLTGTSRDRRQETYDAFLTSPGPAVLIVPYSILRTDTDDMTAIANGWLDTFVADESHHLKNRQSQVHKAAVKVARRVERLALITGTPLLNDAEECWSSLHLIDPKTHSSFWRWARQHFWIEQTTFHGKASRAITLVGDLFPGHEDILRDEIGAHLLKRPMDALLPDLPPVNEQTVEVELSDEERRHYDSMVKHFWMRVGGKTIFAANEVTKITRLRQLVSDFSAFEEETAGTKVQAVVDLVHDLAPEQVVIMVSFKAAAESIVNLLGADAVLHTGNQAAREREDAVARFAAGEVQVIVGTHETMGEGVDGLQVAHNLIFLDRDWTPARNEQAIARVRRSGQEAASVNVYTIVARGTVDAAVAAANERKQGLIDSVIGQPLDIVLHGQLQEA